MTESDSNGADAGVEKDRGLEVGVEEDCGGWGGRGLWRLGWKRTVEDGVEEGVEDGVEEDCGGWGGRVL